MKTIEYGIGIGILRASCRGGASVLQRSFVRLGEGFSLHDAPPQHSQYGAHPSPSCQHFILLHAGTNTIPPRVFFSFFLSETAYEQFVSCHSLCGALGSTYVLCTTGVAVGGAAQRQTRRLRAACVCVPCKKGAVWQFIYLPEAIKAPCQWDARSSASFSFSACSWNNCTTYVRRQGSYAIRETKVEKR